MSFENPIGITDDFETVVLQLPLNNGFSLNVLYSPFSVYTPYQTNNL